MSGGAKEWIVQHGQWIVVVALALWLPPLVFSVGANVARIPETGYHQLADLASIIAAAQLGMMIAALPGLSTRTRSAWLLLLGSLAAGVVGSVWRLVSSFRWADIVGTGTGMGDALLTVVILVIVTYLLFQIRPLYENRTTEDSRSRPDGTKCP